MDGGIKARIEKAALLHDIGKVVLRAEPGPHTHSAAGTVFLRPFLADEPDILRAVGHHHAADLRGWAAAADDISYLIYEADNLAASTDRRKNEEGTAGFSATMPLASVFNVFSGQDKGKQAFHLRGLLEEDTPQYPVSEAKVKAPSAEYQKLVRYLESNFQRRSPVKMEVNELLRVLEAVQSYVPSSTAVDEAADISLYDHQKLTAAFAVCMYMYFSARGMTDYRALCFGNRVAEMRRTEMFLLVSGDLSGIQNFLYTIPSKGALKSLRGRSFYLDLLLENLVDELLTACGLSRSCLLYTGGGHFYMLLPNTPEVQELLSAFTHSVNDWFLQRYGSRLYLAMGWMPCAAASFFADADSGMGKVFQQVSQRLAEVKLCRYDSNQLAQIFSPQSDLNKTRDGQRECSICHISSQELLPYGSSADTMACEGCRGLYELGERLLQHDVLAVFPDLQSTKGAVPLPGWKRELYLVPLTKREAERQAVQMVRLYVKNRQDTGALLATELWMGDYSLRQQDGKVMELEQLARLAGGAAADRGIERIGVMRADVDNLGAAFLAGFPTKVATLSRTAVLSRQLSLFFKRYVNGLCAGQVPDGRSFALFADAVKQERAVHIVYSGGDDMFLVGAWDEIIELAVDIRRAFARFTAGKLTFSAGIGLFDARCPIAEMARRTGELEDYAKQAPGKDSIALFGMSAEQYAPGESMHSARYSWQVFEEKVCGEKLAFLQRYFALGSEQSPMKLSVGKGKLYRLLDFAREIDAGKGRINLAQFAYVLARLEPRKSAACYGAYQAVRQKLYAWYQCTEDRGQLATALELVIYGLREKGVK